MKITSSWLKDHLDTKLNENQIIFMNWESVVKVNNRLRLTVFRTSKNIYAQIIDDSNNKTLVAASSMEKDMKEEQLEIKDKKKGRRNHERDHQNDS